MREERERERERGRSKTRGRANVSRKTNRLSFYTETDRFIDKSEIVLHVKGTPEEGDFLVIRTQR